MSHPAGNIVSVRVESSASAKFADCRVEVDGARIVSTRHDRGILAIAPFLALHVLEDQPGRSDALDVPRVSNHRGDLHNHEVAHQGENVRFVSPRYSCSARVSQDYGQFASGLRNSA